MADGPSAKAPPAEFRFGFLCHGPDGVPDAIRPRGWTERTCEDFRIWLHPETRVGIHARAEGAVVVLGEAFVIGDACGPSGGGLAGLAANLSWDDPWPALDGLGGRHAILLLSGGRMRAAHDAIGARSLFYTPGRNVVASHARLLAGACGLPALPATAEFMRRPEYRSRTVRYLPGDITVWRDVHALVPNNAWEEGRTRRYWPRAPRAETGMEEFLAAARRYLDAFAPFVRGRGRPVFGVTGGIDCRAAFAAFGNGFDGVTWTRNFPETERPIVDAVVAHLEIPHRYMTEPEEPGDASRAGRRSAGGLRPRQPLVEAMRGAYAGRDHVFVRGLGGEVLRGFPAYRKPDFDLTPEGMTRAYGTSIRDCEPGAAHRTFCVGAFAGFLERANCAGLENFGYRAMDHFYWEHRMGMWGAAIYNELDPALCSLPAFNGRALFETALRLPEKARLSKALLRDVTALYDPDLAAIRVRGLRPLAAAQRLDAPPATSRSASASSTPQSAKRIRTAVSRWLRGWGAPR